MRSSIRRLSDPLGIIILFGACCLVALLGSWLTRPNLDWYAGLEKPSWTPPNAVFTPAWLTLFALMAIAASLVWQQRREPGALPALFLFGVQLALNVGWSAIFFAGQMPGLAAVEIVLLWLAIAATLVAFWRISKGAGMLLVPYLIWVSFAAALNISIWQANS